MADEFIRVRLPRVDLYDLSLFDFDYDLTMMIFFLDPSERIYSRYGGRDSETADGRMSLEGLKACMISVLAEHKATQKRFAPRDDANPVSLREGAGGGRCLHCHQVKEALHRRLVAAGEWSRDRVWRYPLPDNLGIVLDVDKGNVVEKILPDSEAARKGLKPGDVLKTLGQVPIHSFGDATFALDKAPAVGTLMVEWQRGSQRLSAKFDLQQDWRKTDITWRPSMRSLIPNLPVYGTDLTAEERKQRGLSPVQVAFFQSKNLKSQAEKAGIRAGDIILGVEGKNLNMTVDEFVRFVHREYLIGETITLSVLRDGEKPKSVTLTLQAR